MLGMGLVLHGQVAAVYHMREEMESTFFLWRWVARLTFAFQDDATQAALTAHDFRVSLIREADRGAWTLVAVGVILASTSFLVRLPGKGIKAG